MCFILIYSFRSSYLLLRWIFYTSVKLSVLVVNIMILFVVVNIMSLSVTRPIQQLVTGWQWIKWKGWGKKQSWASFYGDWGRPWKTSVRTASALADIQSRIQIRSIAAWANLLTVKLKTCTDTHVDCHVQYLLLLLDFNQDLNRSETFTLS